MFPQTGKDSSRNQSGVTRWGILRKFESGNVRVNTGRFLGYDKNKESELVIKTYITDVRMLVEPRQS